MAQQNTLALKKQQALAKKKEGANKIATRTVKKSKKAPSTGFKGTLDFVKWQEQTIKLVEEIKKQQQARIFTRLRYKLLKSEPTSGNPHTDGRILAQFYPHRECKRLVAELHRDPTSAVNRLKLLTIFRESKKEYPIEAYLNMMLQAMIPLYLGDISPAAVQMMVITYRTYLDKLINTNKKELLTLKSKQLQGANLAMIKFNVGIDEITPQQQKIMSEIKVCQELLDRSSNLLTLLKTKMTAPLHISELEEIDQQTQVISGLFSGGGDKEVSGKKRQMVIGKTLAVIDMIKHVPPLHSIAMKLADKLKRADDKLNYSYVVEGRLHMQAMQYFILRIEVGDFSVQEKLLPTYKKALGAYKKALTLTKNVATKADLPVLMEFALVTHYGYIHRELMKITKEGILTLLKQGKNTIDQAVMLEPELVGVQSRIMNAIFTLEETLELSSSASSSSDDED